MKKRIVLFFAAAVAMLTMEVKAYVFVHLNKNGGNGGTDCVIGIRGEYLDPIVVPTKRSDVEGIGYKFNGYYGCFVTSLLFPDVRTRYYDEYGNCVHSWDAYVTEGDFELLAEWITVFTITFDKQGGSGGTSTVSVTHDSAMPSITIPTLSGYTFDGYWTEKAGGGTQYYTDSGVSTRNWDRGWPITLFAKWGHKVTLDWQGGSGGTVSVVAMYGSDMPSITVPTRSGYAFGGYFSSIGGNGTQYYTELGESALPWDRESATTLYAKWGYRVTLDRQGGDGGTASVVATYDGKMPKINVPKRSGYTFCGYWSDKDGAGTQYYTATGASAHKWDMEDAATLYAKWQVNQYTVTFDANGGTGGKTVTQDYGTALSAPTVTREHSVFIGWKPDFTGTVSASNIVYVAQWHYYLDAAVNSDGTITIKGVNFWPDDIQDGIYEIPSEIEGRTVTCIVRDAFKDCVNIRSITIPNSVTSIWEGAFSGCSGLEEITLPFVGSRRGSNSGFADSVFGYIFGTSHYTGSVRADQYYSSSSAYEAFIPSKLRRVVVTDESVFGRAAFQGCSMLASVTIPEGVTSIGKESFRGCSALESVMIPRSVTYVDNMAFIGCGSLMCITVDDANADYKSENGLLLSKDGRILVAGINGEVEIPDGVTYISDFSFYGRRGLTHVTIPDSVMYINSFAFADCGINSITIPSSVISMGTYYAFNGFEGIVNVMPGDAQRIRDLMVNAGCGSGIRIIESLRVVFNAHGGTVGERMRLASEGDTVGTLPQAVREGYTFRGWFTEPSGGEKIEAETTICGLLSCHAQWTPNTYSVTLDSQSGIGGTESVAVTYDTDMPPITVPTRVGYVFGGYWTGTDGSGTQYYTASGASAHTWNMSSAATLYAKWLPIYVVTLDQQGGSGGSSSAETAYGYDMPPIAVPTRVGFVFDGYWSGTNGGGMQYYTASGASAHTWNMSSAATLYAKWLPIYAVTLDQQGGSGGTSGIEAMYGSQMPRITVPTRPGYTFRGYWTGKDGTGIQYYNSSGVGACAWKEIALTTLYAHWIEGVEFTDSATYCVIDLSAGANAASYPIAYMATPPDGGFNTYEYKTTKLVLRLIEPGAFKMGGTYDVILTKPFYCGLFEVTQKQYELVAGSNPSSYNGNTRPVETVSWNSIRGNSATYNWPVSTNVDPTSFVGKLQARTGLNLDLPTEAQWEYACRAGTTSKYNNGGNAESDLKELGRYTDDKSDGKGGYTQHTTVGSYMPNAWGLYDMHGNVYEWCLDWYGNLESGVTDPNGPSSASSRVDRGGGYNSKIDYCNSSYRMKDPSASVYADLGFRLVRTGTISYNIVTFDVNGGSMVATNVTRLVAPDTAVETLPLPTREGYAFRGWFTAATGGTQISSPTVVTGDVTYYAHWAMVCTVTFDANGGSLDASSQTMTIDEGMEIGTLPTPNRMGHTFDGWRTSATGGAPMSASTIVSGNMTCYAHWTVNQYAMTFDANGGTGGTSESLDYGVALSAPTVTRDGHTFTGWVPALPETVPASNATYTAQWKINQYTVTFDANGGTGGKSAIQDYGTTIFAPEVTRNRALFVGWWTAKSGGTQVSVPMIVTGNVTYYAHWTSESEPLWKIDSNGVLTGIEDLNGCTDIVIPSDVKRIGSSAFKMFNGITSIKIPDSVTIIDYDAFYGCTDLTSVTIGNGVRYIGEGVFRGCIGLTSVTIGNGVWGIGKGAFRDCSGLTSVTIPNSVRDIEPSAFFGCGGLTNLTIGSSVTSIGYSAFSGCIGLTSLTIPDSVTSIGLDAFYGCSGLASVIIGKGVMSIGSRAFEGCYNLAFLTIPNSLTSIGDRVFQGCSGLTSVTVPQNVLVSGFASVFPSAYKTISSVVICDGVMNIGIYAFSGCGGLTNVTIGNSVTNIGYGAFYGCRSLTSVTIGNGVTSIENAAFSGCSGLTTVTIPDGVTSIGSSAFYNCSGLTSVTIPDSVTSIGSYAFYGCNGLTRVYASFGDAARVKGLLKSSGFDVTKVNFLELGATYVVFDANGGVVAEQSRKVASDGPVGELPIPTRSGYTFAGWFTAANGGVQVTASTSVTDNVTYYAHWTVNQYTVTFNANGGTGGTAKTQNYGTSLSAPTVTRTGYTFNGWSPSVPSTVPAGNVTYTAQWKVNQYTVTFNANGGTGGKTVTQNYGTALMAPTVTRTGYTFNGWSPSVPSTVPAGNVTYTAQWKVNQYMVTFNANGGTGGKTVTQNYGTALSAPTVTRTGYTFSGWSPSVPSTVPAGNVTYTAQWTANRYTVTFNANGGTGGKTVTQNYGSALSAPTVTRTGYTFNGWSPSVPSTVPAGNVTYTAQWTANRYTVTFDANGGKGSMADQPFVYDEPQALAPAAFTAEEFRFAGWKRVRDGEVSYIDQAVVSNLTAQFGGVVALYAAWEVWTKAMQDCDERFGGAGDVSLDANGNIVVTLTNDVSGTVEIPDNVGTVTIDLNGHNMVGDGGEDGGHGVTALPGPAIRIVKGDGEGDNAAQGVARLAIVDTSDGEKGQIAGGGESAGVEIVKDAATGLRLDVEEGVSVFNGDGTEQEVKPRLVGTGTVTVPKSWKTGQKVTWKATADKGSVFARWEGPLVDSLNLTRNERRNPSLAFAVPEGFATNMVTAVFLPIDDDGLYTLGITQTEFKLKEAVSDVCVTDDSQSYVTATASGLPSGLKFDAKKMCITGAPTKGGVYWVQIKAKNASGYQWAENIKVTVSGDGTEAKEPKLTRTAYYPLTVVCANEGGTVSGTGVYAEGKKVTIKATAAKGYVFAGWYETAAEANGGGRGATALPAVSSKPPYLSLAASMNVIVPEMRYVFAKFVTAEEDRDSIALAVDGVEMAAGAGRPPYQTNIWAGVYVEWPVAASALSETKVKVAGLPAGLKFTEKPVTSNIGSGKTAVVVTNVPAYTIYGAPTAASKTTTDRTTGEVTVTPSAVKITVTTAGKSSKTYQIDTFVDALPAWAVGTFDGVSGDGRDGARPSQGDADAQERVPPEGLLTLTVAANGKISGKVIDADGTWTLSAASFDSYDAESETYVATVIGKNGKMAITNEMEVSAEEMRLGEDASPHLVGVVSGATVGRAVPGEPYSWTAWQNLWKTEPWKTDAKPFAKAPALSIDAVTRDACPYRGTITLKFAASGAVTASGKFVTGQDSKGKDVVYSASCSSVLVPEADAAGAGRPPYRIFLYFPPKAGKFEGYADEIPLVWGGVEFTVE